MGGKADKYDNSVEKETLQLEKDSLDRQTKTTQAANEMIAKKATDEYAARRRNKSGRASLIATSEAGVANAQSPAGLLGK